MPTPHGHPAPEGKLQLVHQALAGQDQVIVLLQEARLHLTIPGAEVLQAVEHTLRQVDQDQTVVIHLPEVAAVAEAIAVAARHPGAQEAPAEVLEDQEEGEINPPFFTTFSAITVK